MTDCAVIGQGIAGTCMVHALLDKGLSVRIYHDSTGHMASLRAAGVINPITGRRFVKTWKADEIIPYAYEFYQKLSDKMQACPLIRNRRILHAMSAPIMEENWLLREGEEGYQAYMGEMKRIDDSSYGKGAWFGEVLGGLQVRMAEVLEASASWFASEGVVMDGVLKHYTTATVDLPTTLGARTVIFCEGAGVRHNPHFSFLPHLVAKGEAIICHIPNLESEDILKAEGGISIVPLWEKDTYWVGSTYEWDVYDPEPTDKARLQLESGLRSFLNCQYEVIDHIAGIRPAAKDRRPFVGEHPDDKGVYLLNGLGTKGASLAPFCARALAEYISDGVAVPAEMNLLRYYKS